MTTAKFGQPLALLQSEQQGCGSNLPIDHLTCLSTPSLRTSPNPIGSAFEPAVAAKYELRRDICGLCL